MLVQEAERKLSILLSILEIYNQIDYNKHRNHYNIEINLLIKHYNKIWEPRCLPDGLQTKAS